MSGGETGEVKATFGRTLQARLNTELSLEAINAKPRKVVKAEFEEGDLEGSVEADWRKMKLEAKRLLRR